MLNSVRYKSPTVIDSPHRNLLKQQENSVSMQIHQFGSRESTLKSLAERKEAELKKEINRSKKKHDKAVGIVSTNIELKVWKATRNREREERTFEGYKKS